MANEGAFGSLGGMGAGALLGNFLLPGGGALLGAGLGGTAGGILGSLFSKRQKTPDISSEIARIVSLFAQLRAQQEANINRQAAQGRTQAASNLASRRTYRSPVAENTFNALEGERLNALATSGAQLAGQEAQTISSLLRELLGLDVAGQERQQQVEAARTGQLTGLGANLLLEYLRGRGGRGGASYGRLPGGGLGFRTPGDVANLGPSANFYLE